MNDTLPLEDWVRFIGEEYLESFIKSGGTSVKFAVTPEELNNDLVLSLADESRSRGCLFVEINAAAARVHMPQDIFFAISRQAGWRLLARRAIVELARSRHYPVADVNPMLPGSIYAAIGEANQSDGTATLRELRPIIREEIAINRHMARDFRIAMSQLCLAEPVGSNDQYLGQPLIEWLTGENTRISNVRHFEIHTPINRTTARHFMESAFYWIRYAGYSGVVIALDNTQVTIPRRPQDGSRFYTKAMVMDHYELLRELIDSAERLSSVLVVVVASLDFLDENPNSRGFGSYRALMTRVMNDVHDKNLVNPMASLVQLSDTEAQA